MFRRTDRHPCGARPAPDARRSGRRGRLGGDRRRRADETPETPPTEGQPIDIGFIVLQHGMTPAPWETATVHFTNTSTGKTMDVVAKNDRSDGHFIATVTPPEAGFWSWQVTLQDLQSDHLPIALTVRTAAGEVPGYDPGMTAVNPSADIARLDAMIRAEQVKTNSLTEQVAALTAERDALAAADGGGLPILAVLTLAILAGATAGFAMTWLAGRPGPDREGQPSAARSRPGVTCSWRRRPNRATRSGSGAASSHVRSSASPSA